jgi:hypothetical protein
MKLRNFAAVAARLLGSGVSAPQAKAQTAAPVAARNIALVHGAWADGSSWSRVIPLLQPADLHPLPSLPMLPPRRAAPWPCKVARPCRSAIPGAGRW